jgi:endonuclease YncB( thermonuclease family)
MDCFSCKVAGERSVILPKLELPPWPSVRTNPAGRLKLIVAPCYRPTAMRACIAIVFFLLIVPGWALDLVIKDGDTLTLDGTEFRLDSIDAPEKDQVCVDDKGALWACGIEARDHLAALIGERVVRCEDMGADTFYPKRRMGRCSVEGENMTLNQRLVREGWALSFEPYAKGRFKPDETDARDNRRGLWTGCFAAPRDFRRWRKSLAALFGTACPTDARNILFPDHPNMPPGCSIKGKVALRAEIVGYRGIYHMEGCRSYVSTKKPNRWFCSEEEARAAGFRKSYRC